jgi:hypothetical protein
MTGVHCLQHVKRLLAADFADDDAIGAHTQAVDEKLPLANGSLTFYIGGPRFQADNIFVSELKLSGVFNRYNPLSLRESAAKAD